MNYAAGNSRLKIVRWLQLNRTEVCTVDAMDFAFCCTYELTAPKDALLQRRFLHENMSKDTF
ncbi:hypothetical protein GQ600_5823 [Phytophthora cactorum]|nr:hypothetical protein GQ600_5823 [Phytophthora cactorum]